MERPPPPFRLPSEIAREKDEAMMDRMCPMMGREWASLSDLDSPPEPRAASSGLSRGDAAAAELNATAPWDYAAYANALHARVSKEREQCKETLLRAIEHMTLTEAEAFVDEKQEEHMLAFHALFSTTTEPPAVSSERPLKTSDWVSAQGEAIMDVRDMLAVRAVSGKSADRKA